MKLVLTSADADEWSRHIDIPFYEATIETNAHNLSLIFADLAVDRADIGDTPFVVASDGPDHKFPIS
jgi:hypothetical protein